VEQISPACLATVGYEVKSEVDRAHRGCLAQDSF